MKRADQKRETAKKVRDAAWKLFVRDGFEATTTKSVAVEAGVATGTVFVHADDKTDLLMLVMHDRLEQTIAEAFPLATKGTLLDRFSVLAKKFYALYAEAPEVSRAFLSHSMNPTGKNGALIQAQIVAYMSRLAGLVADAQKRGEVAVDLDPLTVATLLFQMYFSALQAWLVGYVPLDAIHDVVLRPALHVLDRGLRPRSEPSP